MKRRMRITDALNYSTVHHFSRQFMDKFGITPTEYAKSIRQIPCPVYV